MDMKIKYCFCTPKVDPYETLTYQALQGKVQGKDIYFANNNTRSLASNYNRCIRRFKDEYDWIVLLHDDIKLPHINNLETILSQTQYDICGLAGARNCEPKEPALWHLMCKREDYRGAVAHPVNSTQHMVTSFGPMPSRVLVIDGLFMAIRTESIVYGLEFDESNPGKWHHYDMDFCLTANKLKKKIGVIDFPIIHESPGLLSIEDEAFQKSQEWFLNKWANT